MKSKKPTKSPPKRKSKKTVKKARPKKVVKKSVKKKSAKKPVREKVVKKPVPKKPVKKKPRPRPLSFPEGFGYHLDPELATSKNVMYEIHRQLGKARDKRKPWDRQASHSQVAAGLQLFNKGDKRNPTEERLFRALLNRTLVTEALVIAAEENLPDSEVGEVLTLNFFSS
jgi:hypothetical protein